MPNLVSNVLYSAVGRADSKIIFANYMAFPLRDAQGLSTLNVIRPTLPSFFSLFFLPFRYNMPFLCPHVICQSCQQSYVRLFPASICQALPASLQSTTGCITVRLCQAHSSLTLDHLPSFLSHHSCHSPSRSMSLSLAINLSHSVAYATLSQDDTLCLLSLLSLIAPHLLILTPWHTLAFSHSLCLCISLTHVVSFSHVVALSF